MQEKFDSSLFSNILIFRFVSIYNLVQTKSWEVNQILQTYLQKISIINRTWNPCPIFSSPSCDHHSDFLNHFCFQYS
jgi:hypothetical protein